jgi:hypothetical protein
LACVEDEGVHQIAVTGAPEHMHMGAVGHGGPAQGHVFVIGLERGGAAEQEDLGRGAVLVPLVGPVIVHLVIVEAEPEGAAAWAA